MKNIFLDDLFNKDTKRSLFYRNSDYDAIKEQRQPRYICSSCYYRNLKQLIQMQQCTAIFVFVIFIFIVQF